MTVLNDLRVNSVYALEIPKACHARGILMNPALLTYPPERVRNLIISVKSNSDTTYFVASTSDTSVGR